MKEKAYEKAPVIILSAGLILAVITFLVGKYIYNHSQGLVWMPLVIIQTAISTFFAILIKKLSQQVYNDLLTGLHNRKYFDIKLSKLKTKDPVSLFIIDIDNFKSINDKYGHIAGDQVLKQFAQILKNNIRKDNIVARWGGEEFAVIMLQTNDEEAFEIANWIRMIVEHHFFSCENFTCKITVSIGIASFKEGIDAGREYFFKSADEALYQAKEKKNAIVLNNNFVS